jgi:rhamnosyltransferase
MLNNITCIIVIYNIDYSSLMHTIRSTTFVSHLYIIDNSDHQNNDFTKGLNNFKNITYIQNNENLGIASALNIGILHALKRKYSFALLLDQDSIIEPSCVYKLQEALNNDPLAYIAGAIYKDPNDLSHDSMHSVEESLTTITSGSLLRLSMIPEIGLHDEKLFIDYVDFEYTLRANKLGYKVLKVGTAKMDHKLGNFQRINFFGFDTYITNHSPIRKYYRLRNSLYVWRKYFFHFPKWVIVDILRSCKDILKCFIFEPDRFLQLKAYIYAVRDFTRAKYGKIDSI